jgi:aspartyl aminopeptidase
MTRDGKTSETTIHQHLVKVDRPILRIPTLAYHLDRQQPFDVNLEDHLLPILGPSNDGQNADCSPLPSLQERHHSQLVELLAEETGVDIKDVVNFELIIYDTQKAARGGVKNDLIFSSRLDNLVMSFCAVEGLIQSLASANAESSHAVSLVALFDDEEIGSETPQGAASNFLPCVIQRLCSQFGASPSAYQQTLARSFAISADMAHAVHPNYASKYESGHKPKLNGGVVIKTNAKGMYSSDSAGITLLEEVATRARYSYHCPPGSQGVPLQHFVVRNDSSCGSTIGPLIARSLGVRTIDVGNAQLSMHSIRETTGAHDIENAVNLFDSFFRHYGQLEDMIVAV